MAERTFRNVDVDLDDLADALLDWFEDQGFEVQDFQEGPAVFIQARKQSLLTTVSGTGRALNIRLAPLSRGFGVKVGPGDWTDKGVGVGIALARFLWLPLRIGAGVATGYGIYQQLKLPEQVLDFVEAYVDRHGIELEVAEAGERRVRRTRRDEPEQERPAPEHVDRPPRSDRDEDIEAELDRMRSRRRSRDEEDEEPARPRPSPRPEAAASYCPTCGEEIEGRPNFCPACGASLRDRGARGDE